MHAQSRSRVALVTGASRGIGATVAQLLAQRGYDVVVNYRSKAARAEEVAAHIEASGQRALLGQADLTQAADVERMAQDVQRVFSSLDVLVLNASGGLEKDKSADYAVLINLTAQVQTVDALLPLMPPGSAIVFVTSHWAHFYGEKPIAGAYEPVAASKKAGEEALRARLAEFAARGVRLCVVSGDVIEGTITPKLLERAEPGLLGARRELVGDFPTVEEFAQAIVDAATDATLPSGHTIYVGATD